MGSSIGKILKGEKAQPAKAAPGGQFEPFTYKDLSLIHISEPTRPY